MNFFSERTNVDNERTREISVRPRQGSIRTQREFTEDLSGLAVGNNVFVPEAILDDETVATADASGDEAWDDGSETDDPNPEVLDDTELVEVKISGCRCTIS